MSPAREYPADGLFSGRIGRTLQDSTPAWPAPVRAPEGAPNVVFVLLDDVGFAQLGCFGSDIDTPTLDRLAESGLRYRNFHTTAMCSPTRACLLTGRNHHTNGMGGISDQAQGFPGYDAVVPKRCGFLSEVLRDEGWATFALGKWHITPRDELSLGATRARWPLGRGFERYYGFMGAETNQFAPDLVSDNHVVDPPAGPEDGYHLTTDLVDHAVTWINDLRNAEPDKPFFCYLATGAAHAPHQVHDEWVAPYRGRFDGGWDAWREATHQRQLEMGLLPEGTELTPRPHWIPAWDECSPDERALYARMMEVYAGFLTHTDHEIGRLVDHLEAIGELDDTILIVLSDNGASAEGGPHGSWNTNLFYNGEDESHEVARPHAEALGSPLTYGHYPFGWAHAGNTPMQRWKRETHEGGTADPLIVHYPRAVGDGGAVRHQYAHVIDVVPTVLDLLGLDLPDEIDGVAQEPVAGVSLVPTIDDPGADEVRLTQYYELLGCRAIYHEGWKAVAYHPFFVQSYDDTLDPLQPFDEDIWELYHVAEDPSEAHDLAAEHPERLRALIDLWWAEAGRYDALPLHSTRPVYVDRPTVSAPRNRVVYRPGGPLATPAALDVRHRPHTIEADVNVPGGGAEGVLVAHGGRFGGYTLFVRDGRLVYHYNRDGTERTEVVSEVEVPTGDVSLGARVDSDGRAGGAATVTLTIDGREVGSVGVPRLVSYTYTLAGEHLCIGYDDSTPVTEYGTPFAFTGELRSVTCEAEGEIVNLEAAEMEAFMRSQ